MENQRSILIFAFAVASYFLFLAWQDDYAVTATTPTKTEQEVTQSEQIPTSFEENVIDQESSVPDDNLEPQAAEMQPDTTTKNSVGTTNRTQLITVTTDVLELKIDLRGGNVVHSSLLKYPLVKGQSAPVTILKKNSQRTYISQSGLLGDTTPDGGKTNAIFNAEADTFKLTGDQELIEIPLTWVNSDGVKFTKTWKLRKGSYLIELDYKVDNQSNTKLNTKLYAQLLRDQLPVETQQDGLGMRAYLGTAYSTDEELYNKYDFEDIADEKLNIQTEGGWVAILQHYFISAWVPEQKQKNRIYSSKVKDNVIIGTTQKDAVTIAPGTSYHFKAGLYIGPKIQKELAKIAEGLDLTVDYGVLWWIGQPIFWVLSFLHSIVGNWGFSIILVTVVVKLFLYPLSNAQYRSFGKMRKIQPKMQRLKERYGDDRQKMGQETMKLYKKEGVNPLGGCFPLLIQMPVFFALYWVLMESVEIRQAPFMLWIDDLSLKDPLFILPLIMGASMWLMQKMQPTAASMDPMQQKIMQFMPVMMTVFFFFFPSGLVLYWVVNNLLSIAQQTFVTKMMEREDHKKEQKSKS